YAPACSADLLIFAVGRNPIGSAGRLPSRALTGCGRLNEVECYKIADADQTLRQIAMLRDRLAALDRERLEIADRLPALERTRTVEAKQPTGAKVTMASPTTEKIALFRKPVPGARGRAAAPVGKPEDGKVGVRADVPERVGPGSLRQASDQVRGMPEPGVRP